MKKILTIVVFFFFLENALFAQACAISKDTMHLDVNNARVVLQPSGDFFWNRDYEGFYVPKKDPNEPNTSAVFAAGLWLGGIDSGGNLRIAAQTYGASGGYADWWPGPINISQTTTNATVCNNFDKLWKVTSSEIAAHINDYESDGIINGAVPNSILEWPGQGNPESLEYNQFVMPDQPLAPFVDRNGNSIYEPMLGDYPNVPGDQAIWWVFNDEGGGQSHGESTGNTIKAEVQVLAFAFKGENNDDIANTTFYEFKIYNRGLEELDSGFVALWLDPQLGCDDDDYFGCSPSEKMAFIYNADSLDGSFGCVCAGGIASFCDTIPMTAFKMLQGPINVNGIDVGFSSFTYYNNYGGPVLDPPPGTVDPATDLEYYRYMTGSWKDSSPFINGYDGYSGSSTPYLYAFDGNPADISQWSLLSESLPNYRRCMLINSGPFNLSPGQSTSISYAAFTNFDVTSPDIQPLIEMGNNIQTFYDNLPSATTSVLRENSVSFYPNPLISEGKLTTNGEAMESVRLFNLDGRTVREYDHLNTSELIIEKDGLASGFYFYSAMLRNGQLASGKIVVQ